MAGSQVSQGKQATGREPGESESTMEESLTLEQQGQAAADFVAGLVREFGLDAEVGFSEVDEETVQVAAVGDDLGLLVGPTWSDAVSGAGSGPDLRPAPVGEPDRSDPGGRGGYREKRVAALRRFTEGIVHEVVESGEERALEPMSPGRPQGGP